MSKEIKEIREINERTPREWPVYDLNGTVVRPMEIRVRESVVQAILCVADNKIFVPVNSTSKYDILEKMKEHNRKFVQPRDGFKYVDPLRDFLGVMHGVNTKGCYTSMNKILQSTGIEFCLDYAERLAPEGVFRRLHDIFPHLTFAKGV